MPYQPQDIVHIFTQPAGAFFSDSQVLADLCYLLNEKLVDLTHEEAIAPREIYHAYIDKINAGTIATSDFAGGSAGHCALKLIGRDYLRREGFLHCRFESEFEGLRPDVMTRDDRVLVECGSSDPGKIFQYFKNPKIERLVIIPYPRFEDIGIDAYILTPSPDLAELLRFREHEEARKIKKQFQRRRDHLAKDD